MFWILVFGLSLNLIGSILLSKTVIKSDNEISCFSATLWDGNPEVVRSLKKDRKIGKVGLSFLISGFAIQLIYVLITEIGIGWAKVIGEFLGRIWGSE